MDVPPQFAMLSAVIGAHKQVCSPLIIVHGVGVLRTFDIRFSCVGELYFGARPAMWTGNEQHGLVRNGGRGRLVDQTPGGKSIERERRD